MKDHEVSASKVCNEPATLISLGPADRRMHHQLSPCTWLWDI